MCGAPGEVIRYRHEQFGDFGAGLTDPNGPIPPDVLAMITVYCLRCAEGAGYGNDKDRGVAPPHLNRIQQWLAHELDRGDPDHLA